MRVHDVTLDLRESVRRRRRRRDGRGRAADDRVLDVDGHEGLRGPTEETSVV